MSIEKQGRTHSPPGGAPLFSSFHFSLLYHSLTPRRRSIDVLCVNIWQHLPFISHFFLSNWKDKEVGGGTLSPLDAQIFHHRHVQTLDNRIKSTVNTYQYFRPLLISIQRFATTTYAVDKFRLVLLVQTCPRRARWWLISFFVFLISNLIWIELNHHRNKMKCFN